MGDRETHHPAQGPDEEEEEKGGNLGLCPVAIFPANAL